MMYTVIAALVVDVFLSMSFDILEKQLDSTFGLTFFIVIIALVYGIPLILVNDWHCHRFKQRQDEHYYYHNNKKHKILEDNLQYSYSSSYSRL